MLVSAAEEVVRYRTKKHFALLIRLALEPGRKLVRDYLIDLLWPEAPPERGRHSLSQAITVLRKSVGREFVSAHRDTVALAEGVIDVDALRLETCGAEIRGRFLEGFDLRGARGFDEWREGWTARIHPKVRDCLVEHIRAARRIGDFATLERHALVLEELDPFSEDAVRGVMEARAWVGDRSNALRAFNRFSHRLTEVMGSKPTDELERVAGLLREGRRAAPRPSPDGGPPHEEHRFEPEALIGREREWMTMYDAWSEASHEGKPRVIVLLGDPGIGKTTLTNSFVSSCQMEGAVIARAQAYEAERELPYAVLAELVRQLTLQRTIGAAEPEALAELSRLTPEVRTFFPGVPSPAEWPPEVVPLRLADAFLKAVTAVADDNPVVLVVDDIHAADNASVGILHILTRKLGRLRLMLILAGRPAELRASGASSALVTDSAVEELRTILLDGFTSETGAALVARVSNAAPVKLESPPTERILKAGAGNPLAIELLTKEWASHGSDAFLRQLEALDALPVPSVGIPIAIRTVFERQTRRLDIRTRSVLDLAAVLGRRLGNLRLYEIVGCSPGEAAVDLSELLSCGLVREVRGQLEFRNELIRAQAYYDLAESVRKELHQRVAEFLDGSENGGTGLEIAWHFLRGDNPHKALPRALAGAEECIVVGAPSEAEALLSILPLNKVETSAARRLRILLARALLDQSKATQAIPILDVLSTENGSELSQSAEIALLRAKAEQLLNQEKGQSYSEMATSALSVARACCDKNILVRALFESARAGTEIGDDEMLKSAYGELETLIADHSYAELHDAHYAIAFCESALGFAFAADRHIREAVELLRKTGDLTQLSRAYNGLGVVSLQLCKPAEACKSFREALRLANRIGDDSRASTIAANICTSLTQLGDYDEALSIGNYAVKLGSRVLNQPLFVSTYGNMIDAYVLTGRAEEARSCLNSAKEWFRQERSFFARQALLVEEISLALMAGSDDEFLNAFGVLEKESQGRSPYFVHRGVLAKYAARRDALLGREREAIDTITELATAFRRDFPLALVDTLAAQAWLETLIYGRSSARIEILQLLEDYQLRGKQAMLESEGFLN